MKILAIESSCDETAAAFMDASPRGFLLKKNIVSSQIKIHARTGGVVPEVAARNHVLSVLPVIKKTLGTERPDVIAVTAGPGLVTSLLVGVETARTLSYLWKKPLVAVNHIEGHIAANWLSPNAIPNTQFLIPKVLFPAVALVVSGGHTELLLMKRETQFQLLGATRDDAAGEAFDKVAKILDLGYPGGPQVSLYAQKGNADEYPLPRPMIDSGDAEFSFSGLKTAVLYLVERLKKEKKYNTQAKANICASFQAAVVGVLVTKTLRAAKKYSTKTILMGGGVVANHALRSSMKREVEESLPHVMLQYPSLKYCTDNAAMIAVAGYFHARKKDFTSWESLDVDPHWKAYAQ